MSPFQKGICMGSMDLEPKCVPIRAGCPYFRECDVQASMELERRCPHVEVESRGPHLEVVLI